MKHPHRDLIPKLPMSKKQFLSLIDAGELNFSKVEDYKELFEFSDFFALEAGTAIYEPESLHDENLHILLRWAGEKGFRLLASPDHEEHHSKRYSHYKLILAD